MYSKDIEHLEENIEKLAEIFEINDVFKVEEIINVLIDVSHIHSLASDSGFNNSSFFYKFFSADLTEELLRLGHESKASCFENFPSVFSVNDFTMS